MNLFYKSLQSTFLLVTTTICFGQQNGIVKTDRTSPIGIVSFSESSKMTGIGNAKHIDGYVKKYGTSFFAFPVGQNGIYRPFAAEADGTFGAYFKNDPGAGTLPSGGPFSRSQKDESIKDISNREYWDIKGPKVTKVSLTWNADSEVSALTASSLQSLTIVGWSVANLRWEKIASTVDEISFTGGVSTLTSGSITSLQSFAPDNYKVYSLAALASASLPPSYNGVFESAGCFEIKGWVWDENYPNSSLAVELIEGTTVLASTTANIFREDLKANGKGTGNYGFSILLPSNLMSDGKSHQLSVRVRNSTYILNGSPRALSCSLNGNFEPTGLLCVKGMDVG
jgi:hypothetical protein